MIKAILIIFALGLLAAFLTAPVRRLIRRIQFDLHGDCDPFNNWG